MDAVVATALEGGEVPVALVSPLRVVEGGGLPVLLVRVVEPPVTVSVDNDGSYRSERKRRKTVKRKLRFTPRVARSSQQLQILHRRNDKQRPLTPRQFQPICKQFHWKQPVPSDKCIKHGAQAYTSGKYRVVLSVSVEFILWYRPGRIIDGERLRSCFCSINNVQDIG